MLDIPEIIRSNAENGVPGEARVDSSDIWPVSSVIANDHSV